MHSFEIIPSNHSTLATESVVEWFLCRYLSDHVLDLTVEHTDLNEDGVMGWCMSNDNGEFHIQVHNDLKTDEYIMTLIHELYHVMQHLEGREPDEIEAQNNEIRLFKEYLTYIR